MNDGPLDALFGNRTAAKLLVYLYHYGEAYARGAARDMGVALSPVQRQFDKLEAGGWLVSKMLGNTRVYAFNPRLPATAKLKELVRVFYEGMSVREREQLFSARRRPRRRGKPVTGRDA